MASRGASKTSPPADAGFGIGELAREFDLTTRAIRFYEDCGLLAPERTGAGGLQRRYSARDRTRLRLTLRGKRLGLSLAEIKQLVDMYESPRDTLPQLRRYAQVLAAHRVQVEQQLADLQRMLDDVRGHEREARRLLAAGERRQATTAAAVPAAAAKPKPKPKAEGEPQAKPAARTAKAAPRTRRPAG